ncbi:hypothetical protein FQN54_004568 [Arachnomyces sp. PD_36]|nr:hypothetical protein FQN54_004568 [Arachnomyces sp. PD_36]
MKLETGSLRGSATSAERAIKNEDEEDIPTTFNGKLEQFSYTPPRATRSSAAAAASASSPSLSLKRKLEDDEDSKENNGIGRSLRQRSGPLFSTTGRASPRSASSSPTKRLTSRSRSTPSTPRALGTTTAAEPACNLRDTIPENLILLFIGVNPGIMTGETGYVYAHPTNLYWRLLHSSGITTVRHPPSDTYRLPELYSVGNTNIVSRATKDASMLSRQEMEAGVSVLEEKIAKNKPEAVCLVGKSIWETVWKVKKGRKIKKEEFHYGWQDEEDNMGKIRGEWLGARVFVATTTSGLAAGMKPAEKEAVWNVLGEWVKKRREEKKVEAAAAAGQTGEASS